MLDSSPGIGFRIETLSYDDRYGGKDSTFVVYPFSG